MIIATRPIGTVLYTHAIIILGCGVAPDGSLGDDPKSSVEHGIKLLAEHDGACMIISGHVSYKAAFKTSISEAQAMKDYAISRGVYAGRIFVETESKDTLGNFY